MEAYDKQNEIQQYMNPGINMYKKRERTQNWAHQEKRFLLDLCRKDMRIIENKRLDAGLTAIKNKAWKIIHQRFSATFGTDRTCNRLKEQWRRMKACTRNEIMDYNNRVARYGQEIADRKRPSPFTFEIWEFMQEAKRVCKNEALDGVDYSKVPLALEQNFELSNGEADESHNESQKINNQVHIKEESDSDHDGGASTDRLSASPEQFNNQTASNPITDPIHIAPSFTINNIAATLETLNALRNQFSSPHVTPGSEPPAKKMCLDDSNPEMKLLMEMQAKEHMLRMQILEVQLQSAKYNRDIVEINKTIALQKLHDLANRRMS